MVFSEDNTYGDLNSGTGVVDGHYRYGASFLQNSVGVGLSNYIVKPKKGNFELNITNRSGTSIAPLTDAAKFVYDSNGVLEFIDIPENVSGVSVPSDITIYITLRGLEDRLDLKADKITTRKFFTGDAYSGTSADNGKVIKPDTNDNYIVKIFDTNGTDILLRDISDYHGAMDNALRYSTNSGYILWNDTNSGDALRSSTNSDTALQFGTNSGDALAGSKNSGYVLWSSTNSGKALQHSTNSEITLEESTNSSSALQSSTNSGNALYNSINSDNALRSSTNSGWALSFSKNSGDALAGSKNSGWALENSSFTNWNLNKQVTQPMRFYMTSAKNMTFINGIFTKDSFSCPKTIPDGEVYGNNLTASGVNTANPLLLGSWEGTSFTNWFYTGDILADGSPDSSNNNAGPDLSGIPANVRAQIRPVSDMGKPKGLRSKTRTLSSDYVPASSSMAIMDDFCFYNLNPNFKYNLTFSLQFNHIAIEKQRQVGVSINNDKNTLYPNSKQSFDRYFKLQDGNNTGTDEISFMFDTSDFLTPHLIFGLEMTMDNGAVLQSSTYTWVILTELGPVVKVTTEWDK